MLDAESSRVFRIPAFAGMTQARQAAGNEPSADSEPVLLGDHPIPYLLHRLRKGLIQRCPEYPEPLLLSIPISVICGVWHKGGVAIHRTHIELDEKLISEAMKLTHLKTKKALVNYALKELVRKVKRKNLLHLEGKVKWEGNLSEMRKSRA